MITIVVPLDGSAVSERALRPACSIATRLLDARVLLLGCAPDDVDDAQHHLDDRAQQYADVVRVETRLVVSGDPAEVILATVATEPDAVLCMATRGRGRIGSAVLGSVARRIVCRAVQPLLLVGPNCRTALLPAERGRLLVSSDGSAFSDSVVPEAAMWCERLGLEPWIAEVVGPDEAPGPVNREVVAAARRLEVLAAELGTSTPGRTQVLHGDPGRSIASFAERLPAALIAMATHGRSGLSEATMGSVANLVVRHAPCPVLITRPTDKQACIEE